MVCILLSRARTASPAARFITDVFVECCSSEISLIHISYINAPFFTIARWEVDEQIDICLVERWPRLSWRHLPSNVLLTHLAAGGAISYSGFHSSYVQNFTFYGRCSQMLVDQHLFLRCWRSWHWVPSTLFPTDRFAVLILRKNSWTVLLTKLTVILPNTFHTFYLPCRRLLTVVYCKVSLLPSKLSVVSHKDLFWDPSHLLTLPKS